jgi:type II secretory pathway pseudopilin PulG
MLTKSGNQPYLSCATMKPIDDDTRNARRGFVLPAVIFSVAVMSIIVSVALSTASDERRASRATRESMLATYAAEAGLRKTLGSLPDSAMAANVAALNSGDSLDLGWQTMPNKAAYRAVINRTDNGGTNQYMVVVQGRRTEPFGGQSTIVAQVARGSTRFKFGVYSQGKLTISGGGLTDSFDSDVAAYNALTAGSNGDLAGDSTIALGSGTIVKGDVTAARAVTGGIVSGTVTQNATPFAANPVLTCPTGGYTPAASVPITSGITYNATTGVLNVSGGNILTLPVPPTQYYFSQVILSGNSVITFNNPSNLHVDLWIDDLLNLSGGGIANPSGKATMLGIWACGSTHTSSWTLSGGSGAYFSVYAPNHDVTISGNGDLWGALAAKSVNASGGSKIHYDEALSRGFPPGLNAVAGAWSQLPGG